MDFTHLPYDLLFNVIQHLDSLYDVFALQTCNRSLHAFASTRPVYRHIAFSLLARCRPLPVPGFQSITDLPLPDLARAVTRAARLERIWAAPVPVRAARWYRAIGAHAGTGIDWLSPITPRYNMYATPRGSVYCWDIDRDRCVASWEATEKWALWKCRVEFEARSVFFVMARVLRGASDEPSLMEFLIMRLVFPLPGPDGGPEPPPVFTQLPRFLTSGFVLNLFLLCPTSHTLAAFIWLADTRTMGLYVLHSWSATPNAYVFVDTGVECDAMTMTWNWSCILAGDLLVMHAEDTQSVTQYVYSLEGLKEHRQSPANAFETPPVISGVVLPLYSLHQKLRYPTPPPMAARATPEREPAPAPTPAPAAHIGADLLQQLGIAVAPGAVAVLTPATFHALGLPAPHAPLLIMGPPAALETPAPPPLRPHPETHNPFVLEPWTTESAHFVRQWWPTLPGVPRLSCAVLLLTLHDTRTHTNLYTLAQHYFSVPLAAQVRESTCQPAASRETRYDPGSAVKLPANGGGGGGCSRVFYLPAPFEIVCIEDPVPEGQDGELEVFPRTRPLVAVDFSHAAWLEYIDPFDPERAGAAEDERKRLRMVTFPPVDGRQRYDGKEEAELRPEERVRTLEVPSGLDLNDVETINLDQSQGSVILSAKGGKIYILSYD